MNEQIILVVIATRSISLADGLAALLRAIPQIEQVEVVGSMEDAVQRVENIKPRILLLDLALTAKQSKTLLERVTLLSPETLRVVLVDDAQDLSANPQLAEAVLVKGTSPSAVIKILTNLLFSRGVKTDSIYPKPKLTVMSTKEFCGCSHILIHTALPSPLIYLPGSSGVTT